MSGAVSDHKNVEFKAFVLFVKDTPEHLKALNKGEKADNTALCLLKGKDDESLRFYKVNPAAKSTVLVYKDREVKASFVDFDAKRDSEKLKQAIAASCK